MMYTEQETTQEEQETSFEEQEIGLLRELLPRIDGECRAYIKGATKALLYAQEEPQQTGNKPNRAFSY
jgi:hypothetical protein